METARTSVPGLCSLGFSHSACFLLGLVRHRPTCPLVCDSRRKLLRGSPQFTAPGAQQAHADADGVRFKIERCLNSPFPSRTDLEGKQKRELLSDLYSLCQFIGTLKLSLETGASSRKTAQTLQRPYGCYSLGSVTYQLGNLPFLSLGLLICRMSHTVARETKLAAGASHSAWNIVNTV